MNVKELIEILEKLDGEAMVYTSNDNNLVEGGDLIDVIWETQTCTVILVTGKE